MIDLSIVIVNYNSGDWLKKSLDSIYTNTKQICFEVFVVDNNSQDQSLETLELYQNDIQVLRNSKNEGFAKANNRALKEAKGRYCLLLNPDCIVVGDALEKCLGYLDENAKIGALGCKVVLAEGGLDLACRRSFPTPKVALYKMIGLSRLFPHHQEFAQYNLTFLDENEISEVDVLVGAFMMVRREVIEEVGFLDEEFFMYGEDIDWCYRIKKAGWKIVYYPKTLVVHNKGGCTDQMRPKIIYEFYRAMYLFYQKHYKSQYSFIITGMVYSAIWGRFFVKICLTLAKKYLLGKSVNK